MEDTKGTGTGSNISNKPGTSKTTKQNSTRKLGEIAQRQISDYRQKKLTNSGVKDKIGKNVTAIPKG